MTAARRQDIIEVIGATLASFPRMSSVAGIEELGPAAPEPLRRFLVRKREAPLWIRVADQLDLEIDAIVIDAELGSLGLIYVVPPAGPDERWFRQRVGEAVHLKQLLLEQVRPGADDAGKTAYILELVFVTEGSTGDTNKAAPSLLGEVLRKIIREAGFLFAVGINVWRPMDEEGLGGTAAVRRAFAWLLKDTEDWYGTPAACANQDNGFGLLSAVELQDFRLPGKRRWTLEPGQALHLVHGHNGSGKSSLCEALELAVTGTVERITDDENADHAKVLTNRGAKSSGRTASVAFEVDGKPYRTWAIGVKGVESPILGGLPGASFRMDQGLADRLSHAEPAARARIFLDAFFPTQRSQLSTRDEAQARVSAAFQKLPKRLRSAYGNDAGQPDLTKIISALDWLGKPSFPWEQVKTIMPLAAEQVTPLMPLLPAEFVQVYQRTAPADASSAQSAMATLAKGLTDLVHGLEKNLLVLNQTVEFLAEYGNESVSALPPETEGLHALMNEWLELIAATDILEREQQLLDTVAMATGKGYNFPPETEPLLAHAAVPPVPTARAEALKQLRNRRKEFRDRLTRFGVQTDSAAASGRRLKPLTDFRPEALDTAAALGIFGDRWLGVALSPAIREAFTERKTVEVHTADGGPTLVGAPNWGGELLTSATSVREALNAVARFQEDLQDPNGSLDKLWPGLIELFNAATALSSIDTSLLDQFSRQVGDGGPLSRAVNELMALLTPARWAYEDITAQAKFAAGERTLELQTSDKVAMRLRLNTAELNTFSITLFLLCARRIDSPLRIVVLDDPLQNMDELTIVTVARGLGRLLRLWKRFDQGKRPWRLIVLLHSEEDLETLRSEFPCLTYLLPWLSPQDTVAAPNDEIRTIPSRLKQELQQLGRLLKEAP